MTTGIRPITLALTTAALMTTVFAHSPAEAQASRSTPGAVYTATNDPDGNTILAYKRAADGSLKFLHAFTTGGRGSGGAIDPLSSQHSLLLSSDHSHLYAVNSGSGDVSVFEVGSDGRLALTQRIPSGGGFPVSLAERGSLLYVLNAGGAGSVNGFRVRNNAYLVPISGASHLLSKTNAGAASLDISPNRQVLTVSEQVAGRIESFTLGPEGDITDVQSLPLTAQVPFSLTFTAQGYLLDTETFGGTTGSAAVSSFLAPVAAPVKTITASAPLGTTGACWIIAAKDGRHAFVSSPGAGSGAISTVDVDTASGQVSVEPNSATTGAGSAPLDLALTAGDDYLYVLTAGAGTITGFRVGSSGGLTPLTAIGAPPAASGQQGLAAY